MSINHFGFPQKLIIPNLKINAIIQPLGVDNNDVMEVPSNITDVGWFKYGTRPGAIGSAVIVGHLNGKNNEPGVFANLDKLKIGDIVSVENDNKRIYNFVIINTKIYNPGYAPDVFGQSDDKYLNLITCDGQWDDINKSYTKRLIIFAKLDNYVN